MLKLAMVVVLMASPAYAKEHENPGNGNGNGGQEIRGVPAPLLGGIASLPVLAIGYGVYWLARRRNRLV